MTDAAATIIRKVRRSAIGLLAFYVSGILIIMFRAGNPVDPLWWLISPLFLAWVSAPFVATAYVIRRQASLPVLACLISVMAFAVISGLYIYVRDMFGPGARSTSALIFIFLPIYQWAFPVAALIIAAIGAIGTRHPSD